MWTQWWIYVAVLGAILIGIATVLPTWHRRRTAARLLAARKVFHQRREWLEAQFLTLASHAGRPRGLIWSDCEFANPATFARDRSTGELRAFTAVTIKFEAIAGGDMEDVEAVGNHKAATAVFRFDGEQWTTDGRAVFNLNPKQAVEHFHHELV